MTTVLPAKATDAMAAVLAKPMKDAAEGLRPVLGDMRQKVVEAVTKVAFTDAAGAEWPIVLTVLTYKRLKAAGLDLPAKAEDIPGIGGLIDDADRLAEILWVVCEPDAANEAKPGFLDRHAPALTKDEFLARLTGDVLAAAGFAMVDAVIHFTIPRPGPRELYKRKYREYAAASERELVAAMAGTPAAEPLTHPEN